MTSPQPAKRGRDGRTMNPRSLANLRPGAGAGREGEAPTLKHGARSRQPQRSPEWSPAVQAAAADLEARVGDELRDEDGELLAWAVPSVEAVAIQRVAAWRAERYVADLDAKGKLKPADVDLASRVGERYHRALEREALTLRSRLEAMTDVHGFDMARAMARDAELEEREAEVARREAALDDREAPDA
jgi:hypothetical protein